MAVIPKRAKSYSGNLQNYLSKFRSTVSYSNYFNNSREDKEVSFHVIPNNLKLSNNQLQKITRRIFVLSPWYVFSQHCFKPTWTQDNIRNMLNIVTNWLRPNLSNQESTKIVRAIQRKLISLHITCIEVIQKEKKNDLKMISKKLKGNRDKTNFMIL